VEQSLFSLEFKILRLARGKVCHELVIAAFLIPCLGVCRLRVAGGALYRRGFDG
jgi:hypothetical protein